MKTLKRYLCIDQGGGQIEIDANSAFEAAKYYAETGYPGNESTIWVSVRTQRIDKIGRKLGDPEWHDITIDPVEPDCTELDHEWHSPIEIVGGIKENPGVWGKAGGVVITEVCKHCGIFRETDTWAQNPENGVQGLTSITYKESLEGE